MEQRIENLEQEVAELKKKVAAATTTKPSGREIQEYIKTLPSMENAWHEKVKEKDL